MEYQESIRPLYIPAQIQTKWQLTKGVGWGQIIKILLFIAFGFCFDRMLSIFISIDITLSILIIIVSGALGGTLHIINDYNQSIYSVIKTGMLFNKRQRRYKYSYYDKWRS